MYGQHDCFKMTTNFGFPHWKGDNYKAGGLLVLAESAYNEKDPSVPVDPEWSVKGVIGYLEKQEGVKYKRWYLHFKRIYLTVCGIDAVRPWNAENAKKFFHGIVYANYIIPTVGGSPKDNPSELQWGSAWLPFRQFMSELAKNELSPGGVLVLGKKVWENLLDNAGDDIVGRKVDSEAFAIGNSVNARICAIPHPSSWNRLDPQYKPEMANAHFRNKFGSQGARHVEPEAV